MRRPTRAHRLAVLATLAVLAGCGDTLGEQRAATTQSTGMSDLWRVGVMIALGVGALVVSLIIWCLLRYRHRGRDGVPSQRQYNVPLEITYTVIPIVIVLGLFVASWKVQNRVDSLSAKPDVTIEVRGFQWQWQFHYRADDITVTGLPDRTPVMVVPVHETVRFVLTSRDVIHSFYIPQFLFKRDVVPGVKNQFQINVNRVGMYKGYCAEFCGLDHARMTFAVRAVTPADYRAWVARKQVPA
ncbi:MAG: cytochrome c oxidase subunit II [Acidimicrobiia bacterium]